MRNPLNPVDRATLGLDLSYFVRWMWPTVISSQSSDAVYERSVQVISPTDIVESFAYLQRMANVKSLAEGAAKRVGLEATVSNPSWDIYGACHVHVALHQPAESRRMESGRE